MGIIVKNVTFSYSKDKPLFNNLNLEISDTPKIITIIGSTGSGKSTLAQMLNGILLPLNGEIEVFDKTIKPKKNKKLKDVRQNVGLVFQFPEYQLFEETVLKDVMFGPSNFKNLKGNALNLAKDALKDLNIEENIYEKSPFNLSGGQQRKIALAGILAINPKVLILDEPTVGLDSKARSELMNIIVKLKNEEQRIIIIITHDMDLVSKLSDRVIVLNEGKITFDGNKDDLFNNEQLLIDNSLDLPIISKIAKELKKEGLIDYQKIPLTYIELLKVINHE